MTTERKLEASLKPRPKFLVGSTKSSFLRPSKHLQHKEYAIQFYWSKIENHFLLFQRYQQIPSPSP